ncbi:MAG TPA: hypothetical protein VFH94_17585, partial [Streptomyces sp.]|nr:hypothetical protein [Streptomyces sp.]
MADLQDDPHTDSATSSSSVGQLDPEPRNGTTAPVAPSPECTPVHAEPPDECATVHVEPSVEYAHVRVEPTAD